MTTDGVSVGPRRAVPHADAATDAYARAHFVAKHAPLLDFCPIDRLLSNWPDDLAPVAPRVPFCRPSGFEPYDANPETAFLLYGAAFELPSTAPPGSAIDDATNGLSVTDRDYWREHWRIQSKQRHAAEQEEIRAWARTSHHSRVSRLCILSDWYRQTGEGRHRALVYYDLRAFEPKDFDKLVTQLTHEASRLDADRALHDVYVSADGLRAFCRYVGFCRDPKCQHGGRCTRVDELLTVLRVRAEKFASPEEGPASAVAPQGAQTKWDAFVVAFMAYQDTCAERRRPSIDEQRGAMKGIFCEYASARRMTKVRVTVAKHDHRRDWTTKRSGPHQEK